jgi:uncharacterized protein (DUF488 family)
MTTLYTIGFTQKTAEEFFTLLAENNVKKVMDIRINNTSQLAGFAKGTDLAFFADSILGIPYEHRPEYAPTKDLLKRYRDKQTSWPEYEQEYMTLVEEREILADIELADLDGVVFLCSEHEPDQCHRRLLAEYFKDHLPEINIVHLR